MLGRAGFLGMAGRATMAVVLGRMGFLPVALLIPVAVVLVTLLVMLGPCLQRTLTISSSAGVGRLLRGDFTVPFPPLAGSCSEFPRLAANKPVLY